jgi:hypothetical protein
MVICQHLEVQQVLTVRTCLFKVQQEPIVWSVHQVHTNPASGVSHSALFRLWLGLVRESIPRLMICESGMSLLLPKVLYYLNPMACLGPGEVWAVSLPTKICCGGEWHLGSLDWHFCWRAGLAPGPG